MEEDVLDHVKELRRVNIVNTDNNDEDEKADNDDESTTERERELPPAVKLPSLKWTNKRVGGHLRRTRLWTSLHERLQADADARAAAGDPIDDFHLQSRETKYKELFGAVYATSVHLFRQLCARATAADNFKSSVWDHNKVCIYSMQTLSTLILNGDRRQINKAFSLAADQWQQFAGEDDAVRCLALDEHEQRDLINVLLGGIIIRNQWFGK